MLDVLDSLHANIDDVVIAYEELCLMAPRRHTRKKLYFVGHTGFPSSSGSSNRREEHLAIALWNAAQEAALLLSDGNRLDLLDYQLPLKASQHDKGIGKVDLFGVIDQSKPCVIELKIHREEGQISETPLRAYLEALAYAAIVQANLTDIAQESSANFSLTINQQAPAIIVMAPKEYWQGFFGIKESDLAWRSLREFVEKVRQHLGVQSYFLAMTPSEFSMGSKDRKPCLHGHSSLIDVDELYQ